MIVAVGMKINYHKIAGLTEALEDPNSPVTTNYSSKYAPKTFQLISNYKGGNAIFTMPPLPIKCPGAPQKIMYLADDYFRKVSCVFYVCARMTTSSFCLSHFLVRPCMVIVSQFLLMYVCVNMKQSASVILQ